jgi:hypothetical protein
MIDQGKRNLCLHLLAVVALAIVAMAKGVNVLTRAVWVTKQEAVLTAVIAMIVKSVARVWEMKLSGRNEMPWNMPNWRFANWQPKPMENHSQTCSQHGKSVKLIWCQPPKNWVAMSTLLRELLGPMQSAKRLQRLQARPFCAWKWRRKCQLPLKTSMSAERCNFNCSRGKINLALQKLGAWMSQPYCQVPTTRRWHDVFKRP